MDSDDDDIYPENDNDNSHREQREVRMHDVDDEEEGEEVESDSDDDINFITDAKEESKPEATAQSKSKPGHGQNEETRKTSLTPGPTGKRDLTPQANIHRLGTPQDDGRPGTDFPARHTSTLDPLNGNPIHPTIGKPILSTDFDTDFPSESTKPWRKPGADITDYFNYGFDEFTWASYCLKKQQMPQEVKHINQEAEQMKAFVEGIGSGGMPGMPGMPAMSGANNGNAAGGMPGMPSEQEMQQMLQAMMAQGIDPSSMDPNQFMSMMMGGGGGQNTGQFQQGQQPPTGPAGYGGGGYQDNFSGGRGRGRRGGRNW